MPTVKPNPLRLDPTRLASNRRRLRAEFRRRLARLRTDLRELIVAADAFALRPGSLHFTAWRGLDAPTKVNAFAAWIDTALDRHLLSGEWWAPHVRDAFVKGAGRTYDEVRRAALRDPAMHAGGKAEFLRGLLSSKFRNSVIPEFPVANAISIGERLKLFVIRLGAAAQAFASRLATRLVRAVSQVLATAAPTPAPAGGALWQAVSGELATAGPQVDAIVGTELTAAHASGQLAAMAELGVESVEAEVEWVRQAGACPKCREMAGKRFTLAEAEGMLPLHTNCRCVWRSVPAKETR